MSWHRFGALWVLGVLWAVSWLGHGITHARAAAADAELHGHAFDPADWLWEFSASTLENLQSEWAQLFVQAWLILWLGRRIFQADSTASKDDIESLRAEIRELRG